jgi:superfamily II DNA or RNA helicase
MKVAVGAWAWIEKSSLAPSQIEALKAALTIYPKKVGLYPGDPPGPVYLYAEVGNLIGLAREYYFSNRKPHHEVEIRVTEGDKAGWTPLKFAATLRTEQTQAQETLVQEFSAGRLGGLIQAPTGWGKTVFACGMIAKLDVPTLVVVHKEFLMKQWRERIQQFLPDAKIGQVQGDICDYKGKHVVLAMIHSLAQREYPVDFYSWPGFFIVDETHRVGAATWAPVPAKFPTRFRLGITATPRRKDGCENVFYYHLGPILFKGKELRLKPKVRRVWTDFHLVATPRLNPRLISKQLLLRFLCANTKRNALIVEQLKLAVIAGRKILVLSERLDHLKTLEKMLKESWSGPGPAPSTGQYVGGMKDEDYEASKEATVIFATFQLVSEGFDLPELDTEFLTTPVSDVEQAIGRILRPFEGKKDPVVVDFRDDQVTYCAKAGQSRDRFYEKVV